MTSVKQPRKQTHDVHSRAVIFLTMALLNPVVGGADDRSFGPLALENRSRQPVIPGEEKVTGAFVESVSGLR